MASLFHKKSRGNFRKPSSPEEHIHIRKWSSSSTISQASSTDSSSPRRLAERYNPLSLHPPLSFNTSPHVPEFDMVRYEEDEEREARFFSEAPPHAENYIQDTAEYSPVKGKNCYFESPTTKPYEYDQESQWPLKDWQIIPPGLSESSSPSSSTASSPTRLDVPRRRNADWVGNPDIFIRGAWKRRGIVFHLDPSDESWQEQHFELPE